MARAPLFYAADGRRCLMPIRRHALCLRHADMFTPATPSLFYAILIYARFTPLDIFHRHLFAATSDAAIVMMIRLYYLRYVTPYYRRYRHYLRAADVILCRLPIIFVFTMPFCLIFA